MYINIYDRQTPIVLLWGPRSIGKSMLLKRVFKFLRDRCGYTIKSDSNFVCGRLFDEIIRIKNLHDQNPPLDPVFNPLVIEPEFQEAPDLLEPIGCPKSDLHNPTDETVKYFDNLMGKIPVATNLPMLSNVLYHDGRKKCQIIDLPGNDCFNPSTDDIAFPHYINELFCVQNAKVFVIFVELDWLDYNARMSYVWNIVRLSHNMSQRWDKIIFVVSKIDTIKPYIANDMKKLFSLTNVQYPTLFEHFANRNPFIRVLKPYRFQFLPFSAGAISFDSLGNAQYREGNEIFPKKLWQAIIKSL